MNMSSAQACLAAWHHVLKKERAYEGRWERGQGCCSLVWTPPKKPVRSTAASAKKEGLSAKERTGNHSERKRRMLKKFSFKNHKNWRKKTGVLNHSII